VFLLSRQSGAVARRAHGAQARIAAIAVFLASGPDARGLTIGSRHPDGRGAPHEHARDTRAEPDLPRLDGAGAEDRELAQQATGRR